MDIPKIEGLSKVDQILYRTAWKFEMNHGENPTVHSAHRAGLKEINKVKNLNEQFADEERLMRMYSIRKK